MKATNDRCRADRSEKVRRPSWAVGVKFGAGSPAVGRHSFFPGWLARIAMSQSIASVCGGGAAASKARRLIMTSALS